MLTFQNYIITCGIITHFVAIGLILLLICNKLVEKGLRQQKRISAKNYCYSQLKHN